MEKSGTNVRFNQKLGKKLTLISLAVLFIGLLVVLQPVVQGQSGSKDWGESCTLDAGECASAYQCCEACEECYYDCPNCVCCSGDQFCEDNCPSGNVCDSSHECVEEGNGNGNGNGVPDCWQCSDEYYDDWINDSYCDNEDGNGANCGEYAHEGPCHSDACESGGDCDADGVCNVFCCDAVTELGCGEDDCDEGEMAFELHNCDDPDCNEEDVQCVENEQCGEEEPQNCEEVGACTRVGMCEGSDGWECRDELNDDCPGTDTCCCAPETVEPSEQCPEFAPFCLGMGNGQSFCCADEECDGGGDGNGGTGSITVLALNRDDEQIDDADISLGDDERTDTDGMVTFDNIETGNHDINIEAVVNGQDREGGFNNFNYEPAASGDLLLEFLLGPAGRNTDPDFGVDPNNPDTGEEVTFSVDDPRDTHDYEWHFDDNDRNGDEAGQEVTHTFDNPGWHTVQLVEVGDNGEINIQGTNLLVDGDGGEGGDCSDLPEPAQNCRNGHCCTTLQCEGGGPGPGPEPGECPNPFQCHNGQCCMLWGGGNIRIWVCTGIACGNGGGEEEEEEEEQEEEEEEEEEEECPPGNEPACSHQLDNNTCQFDGESACVDQNWECQNWREAGPGQRDCQAAECTGQGWNNSACDVNHAPTADFNYAPSNPQPNQRITFNASTSTDPDGSISAYSWNLGSGATASGRIVRHTYTSEGTYTVNLTVVGNQGLLDSITREVKVELINENPVAAFNYEPARPQPGEEVTFDASASYDPNGEGISSYKWWLGDGTSLMGKELTYTYAAEGNYTVRLKVTDNSGSSNSSSKRVEVFMPNQPPNINVNYQPQELTTGDSAQFDASGSNDPDGAIRSYEWRRCRGYGDISCDTDESGCPNHESFEKLVDCRSEEGSVVEFNFPQTGHYFVGLTLKDNEGGEANKWIHLPVKVKPPLSKFDRDPSYVVQGKEIPVDVLLTKAPEGLASYDSLAIETSNPSIASISDAKVLLNSSGPVNVANNGKSATITGTDSGESVNAGDVNIKLARLTISGSNVGHAQLNVQSGLLEDDNFQAIDYESSLGDIEVIPSLPPIGDADQKPRDLDQDGLFEDVDGNGRLEEADWKLLLENLDTVKTKSYKLRFDFTRDERLTTGDVGRLQQRITDEDEMPRARFSYTPNNPEVEQLVVFNASASTDPDGTIKEYKWNFGDGQTATGVNLDHSYQQAGSYNVTLTVTDNDDHISSTTQQLTVGSTNQPPTASFSYSPQELVAGDSIEVDASDSEDADGTILSYNWQRYQGQGSISCNVEETGCPTPESFEELTNYQSAQGKTASFEFPTAGHYFVELNVRDDQGATAEEWVYLQVSSQAPQLSFSRNPTYLVSGRRGPIRVTIDKLPQGLASYEDLTVKVSNPDLVTIDSAMSLLSSTSSPEISNEGTQVIVEGMDTSNDINKGDKNVALAKIELKGEKVGNTQLKVIAGKLEDDNYEVINYQTVAGEIRLLSPLPKIGDANQKPRDLDQDGLFEDVNGNGRLDSNDWIIFFNALADIKEKSYRLRFDFSRDDHLGSSDVIKLGKLIESRG